MALDSIRASVLRALGASSDECAELLLYNRNHFDQTGLLAAKSLPLEDEPFVAVWEDYARRAEGPGAWEVLRQALVQLRFPALLKHVWVG